MNHLKKFTLLIFPLLLFAFASCSQVTYQGNTGDSDTQLFCMVDSVDENTQVQFWQSVNTSTNKVLYLNDDFTTIYIPSGSIKTCTEAYSSEGLCFVQDTRANILDDLATGALTPGCRYCMTDLVLLSGGRVCFTADGSNHLERQASWYPPESPQLGLDVIYHIENNEFDYVRDTMNNRAYGWPTIEKVYDAGIFNNTSFVNNTFDQLTNIFTSGSAVSMTGNYVGQGATLDIQNTTGTMVNCQLDGGAMAILSGTSAINLDKVKMGVGTTLDCQNAPSLIIVESDILSESIILVADTSTLVMYSTTLSSEGRINVTQGATCSVFNSELTGFCTTNIGGGANAVLRRLNNNTFSTVSINGTGASSTILENCTVSNTGSLSCTNSGVDIKRCRVDTRGFVSITNTEGDIENSAVSHFSNLFCSGNTSTWSLSESNITGGAFLTISNQTGGDFSYIDMDSRGQATFTAGTNNNVRYIRLSLSSSLNAPTLTNRSVEYCYVNGFLSKNLLDQDYASRGADYFNDNY